MTTSHTNGYVRLTTLVAVAAPVLGTFAAAVALFVNMSVAPMQRDIDANTKAVADIRGDLVPRKEHDRDWAAEESRFMDLQRQIDESKKDLHDLYNAHDVITDMNSRLQYLETHKSSGKQP